MTAHVGLKKILVGVRFLVNGFMFARNKRTSSQVRTSFGGVNLRILF